MCFEWFGTGADDNSCDVWIWTGDELPFDETAQNSSWRRLPELWKGEAIAPFIGAAIHCYRSPVPIILFLSIQRLMKHIDWNGGDGSVRYQCKYKLSDGSWTDWIDIEKGNNSPGADFMEFQVRDELSGKASRTEYEE